MSSPHTVHAHRKLIPIISRNDTSILTLLFRGGVEGAVHVPASLAFIKNETGNSCTVKYEKQSQERRVLQEPVNWHHQDADEGPEKAGFVERAYPPEKPKANDDDLKAGCWKSGRFRRLNFGFHLPVECRISAVPHTPQYEREIPYVRACTVHTL